MLWLTKYNGKHELFHAYKAVWFTSKKIILQCSSNQFTTRLGEEPRLNCKVLKNKMKLWTIIYFVAMAFTCACTKPQCRSHKGEAYYSSVFNLSHWYWFGQILNKSNIIHIDETFRIENIFFFCLRMNTDPISEMINDKKKSCKQPTKAATTPERGEMNIWKSRQRRSKSGYSCMN